jgi:hypothetical protein
VSARRRAAVLDCGVFQLRLGSARQRLGWLPGLPLALGCARFGYELDRGVPELRIDQLDASAPADAEQLSMSTAPADSVCRSWGPFGAAEDVVGLGPDAYLKPAPSADGSLLLVARSNAGQAELLSATRSGRGPVFSAATPLTSLSSGDGTARGTPFLSGDGLRLYYYSNQAGGVGNRDLYSSTRATSSDEFLPGELMLNVNSAEVDHMPSLTADELYLAFISQRGNGNNDIWVSDRVLGAAFSTPRALAQVDTIDNEESPTLSADGLELIFASDRSPGQGGLDLWRSTRPRREANFSRPLNLSGLNGPADEHEVALSADGAELFFVIDAGASVRLVHALRSCLD